VSGLTVNAESKLRELMMEKAGGRGSAQGRERNVANEAVNGNAGRCDLIEKRSTEIKRKLMTV